MRWSKAQDITLFEAFKKLLKGRKMALSKFRTLKGKMTTNQRTLLFDLKEESHWRGNIYSLLGRLKKIMAQSTFTAREIRLLKRLVKTQWNETIDFKQILTNFPGRAMKDLKKECKAHRLI